VHCLLLPLSLSSLTAVIRSCMAMLTTDTCYTEASTMPLLTFRSAPGVRQFRVEEVTIIDYGNYDELSNDAIIRFNASSPSHSLDGVSITGASGGTGHPAIEMVQGTLGGGMYSKYLYFRGCTLCARCSSTERCVLFLVAKHCLTDSKFRERPLVRRFGCCGSCRESHWDLQ
jgi:hypothetical protein